jgi:putative membrane protein
MPGDGAPALAPLWLIRRPDLLGFLVLLEAVYLSGWGVLRQAGYRRLATPGVLLRQLAGFALLAVALCFGIEERQRFSFAAHMLQHELLMLACPLLLSARPFPLGLWGLPATVRVRLASALRPHRAFRRAFDAVLYPWRALGTSLAILWGWHLPALYNGVQYSRVLHDLQHISFFASGLLLWWPIVRAAPFRYRWSQAEGVLYGLAAYVLTAMTLRSLLGAYFALTDRPLYAYYRDLLGPAALQDQRLAGAVMWFLPLPVLVGAALAAIWRRPSPGPAPEPPRVAPVYLPTERGRSPI